MTGPSRHVTRPLVAGEASGRAMVLGARLSFAGGVSQETGIIIDRRHPRAGACVTASVLVLASGRGSSTSSNALGELLRQGLGPAAIIMLEVDQIVIMGVLLAQTLYGTVCPVLVADQPTFAAIAEGALVRIHANGEIEVSPEGT